MLIIPKTEEETKATGVKYDVLPFHTINFVIPVRSMAVEISGDAVLDPSWTRIFANALLVAADIAEGKDVDISHYLENSKTA